MSVRLFVFQLLEGELEPTIPGDGEGIDVGFGEHDPGYDFSYVVFAHFLQQNVVFSFHFSLWGIILSMPPSFQVSRSWTLGDLLLEFIFLHFLFFVETAIP